MVDLMTTVENVLSVGTYSESRLIHVNHTPDTDCEVPLTFGFK